MRQYIHLIIIQAISVPDNIIFVFEVSFTSVVHVTVDSDVKDALQSFH